MDIGPVQHVGQTAADKFAHPQLTLRRAFGCGMAVL